MSTPLYVVAGYGRVGQTVTQMLLDHGNRVVAFDPYIGKTKEARENFTFIPELDGTTKEDLVKLGFPDVAGLLIATGSFSANTSIMLTAERYFPRSKHRYQLIIRALTSEDREIFVKSSQTIAGQGFQVVYSEEAGSKAVAAAIMEHYQKQKFTGVLHELKVVVEGDGSDQLIAIMQIYARHKLKVMNELFLNNSHIHADHSLYYAVILDLNNEMREEVTRTLAGPNIYHSLEQKTVGEEEEIQEESKFVRKIVQELLEVVS